MLRQLRPLLYLLPFLHGCKNDTHIKGEDFLPVLNITCDNERYLVESREGDFEVSFDTITTTKSYWEKLWQARKQTGKEYSPYVKVVLSNDSRYSSVNINLLGYGEWSADLRFKFNCDSNNIDTVRLLKFYDRVAKNPDTSTTRDKAEISLHFFNDSVKNIHQALKVIIHHYISFQRKNATDKYKKELCNLRLNQVDSLRLSVPLRIHLRRDIAYD